MRETTMPKNGLSLEASFTPETISIKMFNLSNDNLYKR